MFLYQIRYAWNNKLKRLWDTSTRIVSGKASHKSFKTAGTPNVWKQTQNSLYSSTWSLYLSYVKKGQWVKNKGKSGQTFAAVLSEALKNFLRWNLDEKATIPYLLTTLNGNRTRKRYTSKSEKLLVERSINGEWLFDKVLASFAPVPLPFALYKLLKNVRGR